MFNKPLTILGINPGSKYLGIAVFDGPELLYWAIKVFKGKWSGAKFKKVKESLLCLINRYDLKILAIKKLHAARSSRNLNCLVSRIKDFAKEKGLAIYQYSVEDLEKFFSQDEKINKKQMADLLVSRYLFLDCLLKKEMRNKNPYFIRMFEAIALGIRCIHDLDH